MKSGRVIMSDANKGITSRLFTCTGNTELY